MTPELMVLLGFVLLIITIVGVMVALKSRKPTQPRQILTPPGHTGSMTMAPSITPDPCAPKIVGQNGALANQEFIIPPPPNGLMLGRGPGNNVIITDDMMVSRRHAQIMPEGTQWILHDRDSINGVFVNGQRVLHHVLHNGDVIQLCNTSFRFVNSEDDTPIKPSVESPIASDSSAMPDSMRLGSHVRFEDYVIEKPIGKGGMSVVYQARDAHGHPVAIKVLDVTGEYIERKFIQEGRIGVTLREHPNICQALGAGRSQDNRFYIVMEYIAGPSLRELIDKQTLSMQQIVHIVGQLCDALHYAHQHHIVHRDIKPENILVTPQGMVKVTDFGIAKLTSSVTVTDDRIVGTPEYVSPEQAQAQRITPASDIYSTGIVLYELLTGKPPFPLSSQLPPRQATIAVLSAHIQQPPIPPRQIRPEISPHLGQVALKALAKNPCQRFASVWAMAQAMGFQHHALADLGSSPQLNAKMLIMNGVKQGHSIALSKEALVLGRTQIAPTDLYISGQHIIVALRGNQLWLTDTSRNGTWVNRERIYGEVPLKAGDEIKVGGHILRLEIN